MLLISFSMFRAGLRTPGEVRVLSASPALYGACKVVGGFIICSFVDARSVLASSLLAGELT